MEWEERDQRTVQEWCQNPRQELRSSGKTMEVCCSSYRQSLFLDSIAAHFLNLETSATRLARALLVCFCRPAHPWCPEAEDADCMNPLLMHFMAFRKDDHFLSLSFLARQRLWRRWQWSHPTEILHSPSPWLGVFPQHLLEPAPGEDCKTPLLFTRGQSAETLRNKLFRFQFAHCWLYFLHLISAAFQPARIVSRFLTSYPV